MMGGLFGKPHRPHLAPCLDTSHSAVMNEAMTKMILAVLERAPEWVRHDLTAKDAAIRARAEETLAAMIASALGQEDKSA